uniref:CAAX prenyl protease n=1 Tax=Phaeomonas parva TaxID=124430 RepID=A0A6U4GP64_9STRA|mmetsp:Transcript_31683/g.100629  ORF Transcript_31683/g.100629 Transcript_31683/m.100629 type:complete len:487 (+) Transcript_31683:617-2077(+)
MAEVAAAIEEDEATKAAKTTFAENAADVQYLSWNDLQSQAALLGVKSPSRKRADLEDAVRSHLSQSTTESDDGTDVGQGEAPSDDSPDALIDKLRSKSEKTFHYNAEHMQYQIMYSLWNRFLETAELLLGLSPFAWDMSKSLLAGLGFEDVSSWPILQAIVYLQGLRLVQSVIDLPWSAYSTFHIEAKHGFNKTTVETFVMDFIKDTGLTLTLGSVVLAGMLAVMSWANVEGRGHLFFLYIWAFIFAVTLFFMFIAPTVIMPLFNEFTPLEKSSLLDRIEDVAAQPEIQFPVKKVFVVDGSRRSGHSNAFFFGFFKNKRVVLYDTLLSQVSENEIVAVLCHEFGHWRHGHVLQNFVVSQTFLLTTFFFYASFREDEAIYASFGFKDQNLVIGLFLFLTTVWAPVSTAFGYILTLDSRRKEFEADRFAVRTGHGDDLQRGLLKISLENLGNLDPDWIYSAFNHTHPPLVQRLRAISQYSAELQKKTL